MKRIVLIDGENLMYALRLLLTDTSAVVGNKSMKLASRTTINEFNFKAMLDELLSDNTVSEILWFGARLKMYDQTPELNMRSAEMIKNQSKFVNTLTQQGIQFIKVSYLRARGNGTL
jgi:hypothetical protein